MVKLVVFAIDDLLLDANLILQVCVVVVPVIDRIRQLIPLVHVTRLGETISVLRRLLLLNVILLDSTIDEGAAT